MRKVSGKMQHALDLMAQGWRLEYRISAPKNWYTLHKDGEKAVVVHSNTALGMLSAKFVVEGERGPVQVLTLTDKGRSHAKLPEVPNA